jgi:hypothetical protein
VQRETLRWATLIMLQRENLGLIVADICNAQGFGRHGKGVLFYLENRGPMFLQNISRDQSDYIMSHPTRQ